MLLSNACHLFRNHSINRVTMATGDDLLYRHLQLIYCAYRVCVIQYKC
jgi:hypothetical protein